MKICKILVSLFLILGLVVGLRFGYAENKKPLCPIKIIMDANIWSNPNTPKDAKKFAVQGGWGMPPFVVFTKPETGQKYAINVCLFNISVSAGFVNDQNETVKAFITDPVDNSKSVTILEFPKDFKPVK